MPKITMRGSEVEVSQEFARRGATNQGTFVLVDGARDWVVGSVQDIDGELVQVAQMNYVDGLALCRVGGGS